LRIRAYGGSSNATTLLKPFIEQIALVTGVTTLAVVFCLFALPNTPRFETARGIVAGLALRMSLFFGLIIAHVPLEGVLPLYLKHLTKIRSYIFRVPSK
jgi:hypothetical protein